MKLIFVIFMSRNFNRRSFSNRSNSGSKPGFRSSRPRWQNRGRKAASQNINISRFINKATQADSTPEYVVERKYTDFDLDSKLQQNIAAKDYLSPTPIQDQAIDHIVSGKDLLGIANTGTGKTGAFLIPIINQVISDRSHQILIVTPTRELALQIDKELKSLSIGLNIYSVICIGGTNLNKQHRDLKRRFNFVIGTPGRLKDLINRKQLNISNFKTVVLDEVDRMLDMGFVKDVSQIMNNLPQNRQSLFFSATITPGVTTLISKFSQNLITVSVKTHETAATIDQDIVRYKTNEDKIETLHQLLISDGFDKILIFGRTKHGVKNLSRKLENRGFKVSSIHGNKSQPQRQRALTEFRQNQVKVLVATDVAARGLDILDVTHVINYDLPQTYDDYVHRIGRTGRANKKGKALTFVN
jgi:ATP-dependent RNA helicase RhlE